MKLIIISVSTAKQKLIIHQIKVQSNEIPKPVNNQIPKPSQRKTYAAKKQKDTNNLIGMEQLKFLQAYGITMIPMDEDSTIVENAMESGQTVVLTGVIFTTFVITIF